MSDNDSTELVTRGSTAPAARSRDDLLASYLAEVRRYPIMSAEEERAVAVRYVETGDREAAQKLVTSNLRLVIKIAFQYHRQWANVLDLIQEGNVGLVEALSRYDPYREIRFSSYAQYWIRAMILRFLLSTHSVLSFKDNSYEL
jgi:RNA polymerase sigma-32 factor